MWKELSKIPYFRGVATLRKPQRTFAFNSLAKTQSQAARRTFITTPLRQSQPQDEEDHFHDRSKLDPQRSEETQSATTDEVATRDTAFDPSETSPESELNASQKETNKKGDSRDPLTVSPADKNVSGTRDPMEGGAAKNADKEDGAHSSGGSPRKNRERK
ncbi:hypothetical protein AN1754.2 [Aspergillus nidulans FGSC A4]|jgi:hypothetical protein|uniref:Uncharacterized protein n=1 Tax=Emericella nidulans (strain FGSC A4 / ATCC 38163 / CBS 112.46 / NRRL 194 / M139) TaxID=227321 RepID=Q5BCH6_EMENI|nr:hypothetical protein [Aspergillus nidulans FGSC A4]EAA64040.1 hypothetical protein AN1754.2 [Aspergillus nidulans FGSC A4]CBF85499.1 TPA: conserved hypothetical protein [Aspergillus nidulans FGSC A4]|eukprot:XP_659358.1 hypothetical protein AN1754.2 [Aspergillus nidulans FGSC A4]